MGVHIRYLGNGLLWFRPYGGSLLEVRGGLRADRLVCVDHSSHIWISMYQADSGLFWLWLWLWLLIWLVILILGAPLNHAGRTQA